MEYLDCGGVCALPPLSIVSGAIPQAAATHRRRRSPNTSSPAGVLVEQHKSRTPPGNASHFNHTCKKCPKSANAELQHTNYSYRVNECSYLGKAFVLPMHLGRMTLRIQKMTEGNTAILLLSGELVSSKLKSLLDEMERTPTKAFDLTEVTLVDLETIRFLAEREARGVELRHCPPYIREWISRESARAAENER